MRRLGILVCLSFCVVFAATGFGNAAERMALVIGNSAYQHLDPLEKPRTDAEDVASMLGSFGYEVVAGYDLTKDQFRDITRDFASRLTGTETAILYYSGHGFESEDINYMVPVDVRVASVSDLVFDAYSIQDLMRVVEKSTENRIILLDSYRNGAAAAAGPFSSGFAPVRADIGSYIAMAAQPGEATLPGEGENSPFTAALLKFMGESSGDINAVMTAVQKEVASATRGRQTPWLNSALTSQVSIKPAGVEAAPQQQAANSPQQSSADIGAERAAWEKIVNSTDVQDYVDFLIAYPDGMFASTARATIERMTNRRAPRPAPAPVAEPEEPVRFDDLPDDEQRDLARDTQEELIRVGCLGGRADGVWGRQSTRALENYADHDKLRLAHLEPQTGLLDRLRDERQRVCPLVCSVREVERNGRCVEKSCGRGERLNNRGNCVAAAPPRVECGPGERRSGNRCVAVERRADPKPAPQVDDGCPRGAKRARNGSCYFTPFCSAANKGLPGTDQCE